MILDYDDWYEYILLINKMKYSLSFPQSLASSGKKFLASLLHMHMQEYF